MTTLSLAAQAVLKAVQVTLPDYILTDRTAGCFAAAALRAAVDQVVPPDPCGNDCCITQCEQIRDHFLTIATELEDHQ